MYIYFICFYSSVSIHEVLGTITQRELYWMIPKIAQQNLFGLHYHGWLRVLGSSQWQYSWISVRSFQLHNITGALYTTQSVLPTVLILIAKCFWHECMENVNVCFVIKLVLSMFINIKWMFPNLFSFAFLPI